MPCRFRVGFNYFPEEKPLFFEEGSAYADPSAKLKNQACYEWDHPMSEIINALLNVNLKLDFLHEFPFSYHNIHPNMKMREDGYYEFQSLNYSVPMMFSIKANKKI